MSLRQEKYAKRRNHYETSGVTAFLVGIVVFFTFTLLVLPAIALSTKSTTMDCPVEVHEHTKACYSTDEDGQEVLVCGLADYIVHTHDDNCYDEEGNLICTLPEIREHTHDESCYEEQEILVCDLEENEDHTHTEECYKTEKVLVCGENELHTHDDSCYDKKGNLICGMLELKAHQHDESCLHIEEVSEPEEPVEDTEVDPAALDAEDQPDADASQGEENADQPDEADQSAEKELLVFEESTDNVTVHVEADPEAFPEGTTMQVTDVDDEETTRTISDAVEGQVKGIRAVDITFADAEGKEIEPSRPIRVSMTAKPEKGEKKADLTVVHVDDKGEASALPDVDVETEKKETTASFEADQFSVYAVVYTVDFHWEVNGRTYEFSIPGGGFVSFTDLVEVLGIAGRGEADDESDQEDNGTLEKGDHTVSENTRKFVENVESITFSTPELLSVSRVEENTTVGAIKDDLGLECEYSADLTEDRIEEINAGEVEAGDWALISLKAFDTEEFLIVTMKSGESFQVRVTDASVGRDLDGNTVVISALGTNYEMGASVSNGVLNAVNLSDSTDEDYWVLEYDNHLHYGDTYLIKSYKYGTYIHLGANNSISLGPNNNSDATLFYIDYNNRNQGEYLIYTNHNGNRVYLNLYQNGNTRYYSVNPGQNNNPWDLNDSTNRHHWLGIKEVDTNKIEKAGDWLLYLDEKRSEITIHVGETITLRPYDEWKWKEGDIQQEHWKVDETKNWTISGDEGSNAPSETWTPTGSPIEFTRYVKYDDQLEVRYWSLQGQAIQTGVFYLTNTANNHTIKVNIVDGEPDPVPDTITKTAGIKVNLFDYDRYYRLDPEDNSNQADFSDFFGNLHSHNNSAINYNNMPFWFLSSGGGNMGDPDSDQINRYTQDDPNTGLVNNQLNTDGYPQLVLHSGDSGNLKYLFDTSKTTWTGGTQNDGMIAYPDVEGLFQKDNSDGYYYYNSNVNYAYYDPTDGNKTITLYEHTYTQTSSAAKDSRVNTKPIGFFPFHPYDSVNNLWVNQNSNLNHHLGMSMSVDFMLPSNRLDEFGQPIKFEFSGDDDLWVFVEWVDDDGEKQSKLLLDLGGIHQPIFGSINFTDDSTGLEADRPYTLKVFYLERGGCDSNCSIRFNLPITKDLTVAKKLNGLTPAERSKYFKDDFLYEIGIRHDSENLPIDLNDDDDIWSHPEEWRTQFTPYSTAVNTTNDKKNHTVYHTADGNDIKGYPVTNGQIHLKNGESFTISQLPRTDIFYLAEESQLDMAQFEIPHAERLFFDENDGTEHEEEVHLHEDTAMIGGTADWETKPYALMDTEKLVYTNTLQEQNLNVEKEWDDELDEHDPIRFHIRAKVMDGTAGGKDYNAFINEYNQTHNTSYSNDINAQWTETVNNDTTTATEGILNKTFELKEANDWRILFEHLPKKTQDPDGQGYDIVYSIEEVQSSIPAGYTSSVGEIADENKVYLDIYKFWPDDNANHYGEHHEDFHVRIRNKTTGEYITAVRDENGEWRYTGTTNQNSATQITITSKDRLTGLHTSAQADMLDYAARVNNLPKGDGSGTTYEYEFEQVGDDDPNTSGLVMFTRPVQKVVILNVSDAGALKITKIVQIDDRNPETAAEYELVDGPYYFTVNSQTGVTPAVEKHIQINVENGVAVSYRVADTFDGLAAATDTSGAWALVPYLSEGDYTITETGKNGLMLTGISREDGNTEVVDLDHDKITVHVTSRDRTASNLNAQAKFTNNYYEYHEPDQITLDIVKEFDGPDASEVQSTSEEGFRVLLSYKIGQEEKTITLYNHENEINHDGVKVRATTEGSTISWHITNISKDAADFKIKEAGYDIDGYTWYKATLDGTEITSTVNDWHSFTVKAPIAELTEVTENRRITSDSGNNREFYLEDGDILLTKLTTNLGTLVISKKSLNSVERDAVERSWPSQGGFKLPPRYFSIEEHPSGFKYGNKEITFSQDDQGKTIVSFTQNVSAQEGKVFSVSYSGSGSTNNADLKNFYHEAEIPVDIIKIERDRPGKKLPGAVFTLRQLADALPGSGGTYETKPGTSPQDSDPTARITGLTTFTGLKHGYYEITEKTPPPGYVSTGDTAFYFKIFGGKVTWLEKIDGQKPSSWPEVDRTEMTGYELIDFDEAVHTGANPTNDTFTVQNTPGAALPNAGGPGTRLFTILGSILILGAGVLLWRRRRLV